MKHARSSQSGSPDLGLFQRGSGAATAYASLAWLLGGISEEGWIEAFIGWSLQEDSTTLEPLEGAWSLGCHVDSDAWSELSFPLRQVEESRGVFFALSPSNLRLVTENLERILADHMMLFTHRALFGQCVDCLSGLAVPRDLPVVDTMLVLGPTIPKFVGRVCYSLMSRQKTVAILSPNRPRHLPLESGTHWADEPFPLFCEDSSSRTWRVDKRSGSRRTLLPIEILVPTGDRLASGPQAPATESSKRLWMDKRDLISGIMKGSSVQAKLPLLQMPLTVNLPHGMFRALRQAALYPLLRTARARNRERLAALDASSRGDFMALGHAIERFIARRTLVHHNEAGGWFPVPDDLCDVILDLSWEARGPLSTAGLKAARSKDATAAIRNGVQALARLIGEGAIGHAAAQ